MSRRSFRKRLKQKFGDQFILSVTSKGGSRVEGQPGSDEWKLSYKPNAAKLGGIQFSMGNGAEQTLSRYLKNVSDVRFENDCLIFTPHCGDYPLELVSAEKKLVAYLESVNADIPQRLLIARNEIAHELEVKKKRHKDESTKEAFERACDDCLTQLDKCFEPAQSLDHLPTLAATVEGLQSLDGTAKRVGVAMIALGVALAIPGLFLFCFGLPVFAAVSLPLVLGGIAMFAGGAASAIYGADFVDGNKLPSIKFSKVGRMMGKYGSLFTKFHDQKSAPDPEPTLRVVH